MRVAVTGATGFVGSRCLSVLKERFDLLEVRRSPGAGSNRYAITQIDGATDWTNIVTECDAVIHCAARVHVLKDEAEDPLAAFREVNVEGTANLARQAAQASVKRFVFLSSIKVNGEFSSPGQPFQGSDTSNPSDAYAQSKLEAEQALKKVCSETGMEYVIIRPPLVYGPGVKANFLSMMKWVSRGVPLPLGAINKNRRSLVYIDNLVDLIAVSIEHPRARNQTLLVSDDEDVSTSELLHRIALAMDKRARLLNIPAGLIGFVGSMLGKKDIEQRLCSSLQVNICETRSKLDWSPPITMKEGLSHTANWLNRQLD